MVRIINSFIIILCMLSACKHQELTIERGNYEKTILPLRIDGIYLSTKKYIDVYEGSKWSNFFFFYRNGVVFNGGVEVDKLSTDLDLKKFSNYYRKEDRILDWGIYNIKKDNILEFEKWEPSSGGGAKTNVYHAKILNDTIFVIEQVYSNYDKKVRSIQDTLRFFHTYSKPDSTNRFIKE